jgi:hypothetical protein
VHIVMAVLLFACGAGSGDFECGGKTLDTVPQDAVCDGVIDCWHGQDETTADCATAVSYCDGPGETEAILESQVCDGEFDCSGDEGFDEADCP